MSGSQELNQPPSSARDVKPNTGTRRGRLEAIGVERIRELFDYSPETGDLIRRGRPECRMLRDVPERAGLVRVDGDRFSIQHVIWFWWFGEVSANIIRHKDGDRRNNRIDNLETNTHRIKEKLSKPPTKTNRTKGEFKHGGTWKRRDNLPTQEELLADFDYIPETGELLNTRFRGGTSLRGAVAGSVDKCGYRFIAYKGKKYPAARMIWCWVHGSWPEHEIDHINKERDDNRLINLREAARTCNQRNKTLSKNSTTGIKGITINKRTGGYVAQITYEYKSIFLKHSHDLSMAVKARWEAEVRFEYPDAFTDSTAFRYLVDNNIITMEEANEYQRSHSGSNHRLQD